MKKGILFSLIAGLCPFIASAQGALDAYNLSQTELRGTARYMSMAGAYGALGGDLSSINQNPGGIGVYRSSDFGITLDLNLKSAKESTSAGVNNTVFSCNNVGYVGAFRTKSKTVPNMNWGFSYNRLASFNRHTRGGMGNLQSSLSNYIAGATNSDGYNDKEISEGYRGVAPWLSILAYDSFAINPDSEGYNFQGLYGDGTYGDAAFETVESGGIDEYNFNLGGNAYNKLYWGIAFGVLDINYYANTYYTENLNDAYLIDDQGNFSRGYADWSLSNSLHTSGVGYNFKMGFIFKPINALRLGFAFHTPTFMSLRDDYYAESFFEQGNGTRGDAKTDFGNTWYKIQTPWKFNASAAVVLGRKAIVSFEYQYTGYQTMKVYDDADMEYLDVASDIKTYYKATNTFKIGAEYRISNKFSARLGYSYETSPVTAEAMENKVNIFTSGTMPAYNLVKNTQYVTAGLGYKFEKLYMDLAYVHKSRDNEYHAFSPVPYEGGVEPTPTAYVKDSNNQIVLSVGIRF